MNSYLALRKANKLRFAMVTETSQKQIQDIVHYLQVTSWDISGVEAIKSDLIDMAIQANKDGKELFTVPEEASSFAVEMKKQCATPNIQNLFFILIWYFLYNAIGYLLLFFIDQEMMAPMDTNYIIGMVIGTIGTYILWKYVIRQIPFPMRKHLLIFIALLVVYSVVMYLLVWLLNNFVQPIAAISMNFLGWSIVYWVISVAIFLARLYFYGHNPAVVSRV